MSDIISSLRAYALNHARALRILRSVKAQGQADAYQDMGTRLGELEKQSAAREELVQEVIRLGEREMWVDKNGSIGDYQDALNDLRDAIVALAEWKP